MEEEEAGLVRRLQDQRVKVLKTKNIQKKFQTKERKKQDKVNTADSAFIYF